MKKKQGTFDISDAGFNVGVNVRIRQRNKETGRIVAERNVHNRCLKTELLAIIKFLDGQFNTTMPYNLSRNYIPNYLGVGTNTATYDANASVTSSVSVNDTHLLHEIGPRMQLPQKNTIVNKKAQDYIQLVIVAYLPSEYYNGYTLREAGLFSKASGNNCLFRVTFDGIEKTEDTVVEVNWTITVISIDSQHDAYESVDKTDLKKMMDIVLDKIGQILPDLQQTTEDLKDPAILDYKRDNVSQAKVNEDTEILRNDYLAIKDLNPLQPIIPEGYIYTGDGTVVANDIVKDKVAYSQGEQVIGTMESIDNITITKSSYSDFSLYNDANNRQYMQIVSNPNVGEPGVKKYISSGEITEYMNIPVDILATYFGVSADKIKYGETIMGVSGTVQEGVDTSDATATTNDIVENKTAYVNGSKITGSISDYTNDSTGTTWNSHQNNYIQYRIIDNTLFIQLYDLYTTAPGVLFNNTSFQITNIPGNVVAQAIGLTPDKIKAGETILGITGTYEGGAMSQSDYNNALNGIENILGEEVQE